jgi:hypothetical protein
MAGQRPPKPTERQRLLHALSNKISIIIANVAVLRMQYTEGETKAILDDMEAAAEEARVMFDQLKHV